MNAKVEVWLNERNRELANLMLVVELMPEVKGEQRNE